MQSVQMNITIKNRLGMHARPAMAFVDTANSFSSDIKVRHGRHVVDGKSIMQLMTLAATQGTELELSAEGEDANAALEALRNLIDRNFDE